MLNSGSRWHRWEPHVHAPGTILNDQFRGPDAWETYLKALETATPVISAIGVTDYYSTEIYERVCEAKRLNRLAGCDLIFPNIEMRLAIGTVKGRWANVHLLLSPEDPTHLPELKRFLARLTFKAHGDSFCCNKDDLTRLGHQSDPEITDPMAALEHGSQQFKVSFEELKQIYSDSSWAQQNILIAVAGSETDGTSGVRDPADATLRQEVEKFAHIIFASSAAQREFWLGQGVLTAVELQNRYNGPKPCMHGSDAHELQKVGVPDGDRYSWIKGAVEFDALRQACIDPATRAWVGTDPPVRAVSSQVIASLEVSGAGWAATPTVALNPGLVAVIGARGSGKTALVDMIALGCDALPDLASRSSFLARAHDLLRGSAVSLRWETGDAITRNLDRSDELSAAEYPRARYLSQQFVEELCSAQGMTDVLMQEVERVVFESQALADRDGAVDFSELLDLRTMRLRQAREREQDAIAELSERIGTELEKQMLVEPLKKQISEKAKVINGYTTDRAKLVVKGSEARVARLAALATAAEKVRGYLQFFNIQEQSLLALTDEVQNVRSHKAPEALREAQEKYKSAQLKPEEWARFLMEYKGDVDTSLREHVAAARGSAKSWRGSPPPAPPDTNTALIADDAPLDRLPLAHLEAEIARLEKLVSVDQQTTNRFAALSKRITEETAALTRLREKLADCEGAKDRARVLVQERETAYARVFAAIEAEQTVLSDLYQPLSARLKKAGNTLKKLSFSVKRIADIDSWSRVGEPLFDLRQKGPFKGRGTLRQMAERSLMQAWETGIAQAATDAMAAFRAENQDALLENALVDKSDQAQYRAWSKQFAKWLYSTDHITIEYSVDYDGVDIRTISRDARDCSLITLSGARRHG